MKKIKVAWTEKDCKAQTHVISVDDNGRLWRLVDDRRACCDIGYLTNGTCNVYEVVSLTGMEKKGYIPVIADIFRYRKELRIKQLRRCFIKRKDSDVGKLTIVKYGYIPRSIMRSLWEKRKVLKENGRHLKILLTKRTDWRFRTR